MAHLTLRNFVNGKHADPCEGAYSHVVDPSTGEAYASAPVSSAADVDEAMRAAQDAFEHLAGHHARRALACPAQVRRRGGAARRRAHRG